MSTRRKRQSKKEIDLLFPEEILLLIGQCSATSRTGIRNRALLIFLYRSGLRISEALRLKVPDVDFREHAVRLGKTKSGKSQTRGFHHDADDALRRWLDVRRDLGAPRGAPLFCTLKGGPVSPQYAWAMMQRLKRKAELDKRVFPHMMRHAYAYELERAGRPVTTITELLGHSGVGVTSRYLEGLTNYQAIKNLQETDLPPLDFGQARKKDRP